MSATSPTLFASIVFPTFVYIASLSMLGMTPQSAVFTILGDTLFTRIGASSIVIALIKPSIAAQILALKAHPLLGRLLAKPLVNIIEPVALINGIAYFTAVNAPQ